MISDQEKRQRFNRYKNSHKSHLLTSRFTNETWNENELFREKNNTDFERVVVSIFNNKKEYELLRSNCFKAIKKLNNSVVSKKMISSYG